MTQTPHTAQNNIMCNERVFSQAGQSLVITSQLQDYNFIGNMKSVTIFY